MTKQLDAQVVDAEFITPDPVGIPLAKAILDHLRRYLVLRLDEYYVTLVLWVLFTHAHDCFSASPILAITSATMREGKSKLLEVIQGLVPNPLSASNSTPAGIFRAIERQKPTVIMDEADTFVQRNPELRGILNSSFNRANAHVLRADGKHSTWAPIAIALIGDLPPTLHDRAVGIRMQRKLPWEVVEKLRLDDPAFVELKTSAAGWIMSKVNALCDAQPTVPGGLNDRQADAWAPLLAIADQLGGDWPRLARNAAVVISKDGVFADIEDYAAELISDIEKIFKEKQVPKISTRDLVQALLPCPSVHGLLPMSVGPSTTAMFPTCSDGLVLLLRNGKKVHLDTGSTAAAMSKRTCCRFSPAIQPGQVGHPGRLLEKSKPREQDLGESK